MNTERSIVEVSLTSFEQRVIIRALLTLKENQIKENKDYSIVDELIVKMCDLKEKKRKFYEKW